MVNTIEIGKAVEPTEEETAAALEAAAKTSPATEEEARQQLEAEQKSSAAQRPENVPEKFWNAEKGEVNTDAIIQANKELEKKLGDNSSQKEEEVVPPKEEPAKEEPKAEPTPIDVFNTLAAKYEKEGKLDDTDYASAEKVGWSKSQVEGYIAGQQALADKATADIYAAGGGKEATDSMLTWAKTGMDAESITRLNDAFGSGDVNAATAAMTELKGHYEKANGPVNGDLLTGKTLNTSPQGYQSMAEFTAAMGDPRYQKDPAYRAEVEQKAAVSNIFG